ncbi:hypothetical protein BDD12DRAFT_484704 [Trichophaea hybrida]|nr:hypothetical protein BDD12DRAFT_484704 [Trichophaea hybrida]
MSNLRDVFVRIYPFATELLLQLDIWDTAALSLVCRDVYNHIRQHPTAFSKVDLRDPAAIAALSRVVENDRHHLQNLRHTLRDLLTRVHYYCFSTDRNLLPSERDSVGPPRAFQSLVVQRHVNVRTMILDGTHITKDMLSEVLRMSPTLEVLSLVFTYGCRFDELVGMFNEELQLEKLRELKVWGMGQAHSVGIANPNTWLGWSDELLVRLKTAVEPQGVRLDTTFCIIDDHPGCRISLFVARQCGICGQGGFEIQCNYVEGFPSRRVCRSESICTICYSFYCRNCVTLNLALVSGATKVCQMCPKCVSLILSMFLPTHSSSDVKNSIANSNALVAVLDRTSLAPPILACARRKIGKHSIKVTSSLATSAKNGTAMHAPKAPTLAVITAGIMPAPPA